MTAAPRALRPDLGFRRTAVLLSGGGALGAYEVGVLKVLEAVALVPAVIAGVSIGAINAVVWRAHGGRTAALEATWRGLGAGDVGFRWVTLLMRALGGLVAVLGILEVLLTLGGSRELSGSYWLWKRSSARLDLASTLLDAWMWGVLAIVGIAAVVLSRQVESWLAHRRPATDPARDLRRFERVLLALWLLYVVVWLFGLAWPHRFTVSVLVVTTLVWLTHRGRSRPSWARVLLYGLMPETRGRGLWGASARRRVLERLVAAGDARRLVDPASRLVVSALAIDSGRVCHFVSGPPVSREFVARIETQLGEVVTMREPAAVMRAALASSAIPGAFEPVRIDGRDFVDAGGFSNQPLHVAIADGADAALVVLLSPSGRPSHTPPPCSLFSLGGRLLEIANWRDMQAELRSLPPEWARDGDPARLCIVEPDSPLPGGVFGFDPANAAELIRRGEEDAWRALERAGWVAPV